MLLQEVAKTERQRAESVQFPERSILYPACFVVVLKGPGRPCRGTANVPCHQGSSYSSTLKLPEKSAITETSSIRLLDRLIRYVRGFSLRGNAGLETASAHPAGGRPV